LKHNIHHSISDCFFHFGSSWGFTRFYYD